MKISAIVAVAQNNVIGQKEHIPWHIPEDLKRFKEITSGHHVLMGRKTHESIGKILPDRVNIILSKNSEYKVEGAFIFQELGDAIRFARDHKEKELFIIGGEKLFRFSLPLVEKIYETKVLENYEGDAFFPILKPDAWTITFFEPHKESVPEFEFINLERKG